MTATPPHRVGARAAGRALLRYQLAPGTLDARVIAPLDNLTWDRRALRELFGFDYVWEVYKPAGERRWGYYVVPVVVGGRFVARLDGRREAGAGGARLHGWWWEDPAPAAAESEALLLGLARFLRYLQVDGVDLPRGLDRPTRGLSRAALAEARA